MNKKEALAKLEKNLSEAPFDLKEYALKSWEEQTEDIDGGHWISVAFFGWFPSKEGTYFWYSIANKNWEEAQAELSKLNPAYDHINHDHDKPNWFERLQLHWSYIDELAIGILIGYLLHYLF